MGPRWPRRPPPCHPHDSRLAHAQARRPHPLRQLRPALLLRHLGRSGQHRPGAPLHPQGAGYAGRRRERVHRGGEHRHGSGTPGGRVAQLVLPTADDRDAGGLGATPSIRAIPSSSERGQENRDSSRNPAATHLAERTLSCSIARHQELEIQHRLCSMNKLRRQLVYGYRRLPSLRNTAPYCPR